MCTLQGVEIFVLQTWLMAKEKEKTSILSFFLATLTKVPHARCRKVICSACIWKWHPPAWCCNNCSQPAGCGIWCPEYCAASAWWTIHQAWDSNRSRQEPRQSLFSSAGKFLPLKNFLSCLPGLRHQRPHQAQSWGKRDFSFQKSLTSYLIHYL